MFPSFVLFGKTISTYSIASLVGILLAGIYAAIMAKKRGLDDVEMIITLLFSAIGVLIGGHLLYGITNIQTIIQLIRDPSPIGSVKDFFQYLFYIFGGQVYYGGLIGGLIVGYLYLKRKKLPVGEYSDICAAMIPLFHGFGRIGCFLGGCCYGVPSAFGFIYHNNPLPEANGIRRFPIQLLESALNFILFLMFHRLLKKDKYKGLLLYIYLCTYAVMRFVLEFWRGRRFARIYIWPFHLSVHQYICVCIWVNHDINKSRKNASTQAPLFLHKTCIYYLPNRKKKG